VFAAVLDANVLWPSTQRDVFLSFVVEGIYRPIWSSAILDGRESHIDGALRVDLWEELVLAMHVRWAWSSLISGILGSRETPPEGVC
jgi:hypothetical protein